MKMNDVRGEIRQFVSTSMSALADGVIHDSDNIFELGFVTSMFAMQLLEFLENQFDVEVPDEMITLANFSSVDKMSEMVEELRGVAAC
jgi:Phosphopantetheine attachment site.